MDYLSSQKIQVKAVILGETRVGKTSLSDRFHMKRFDPITQTTISAACQRTEMNISNTDFTFCVWDTAGQERFRSISPIYYRGSHVAIIVFDLTDLKTLDVARSLVKELRSQGPIGVPIVLLGNKCDVKEEKMVPDTLIDDLRKSIGADYYSVSALTGENVDVAFQDAANLGLNFYREQQQLSMPMGETPVLREKEKPQEESNVRCC